MKKQNVQITKILMISMICMVMSVSVWAQSNIQVRVGEHAEYTRVVFDWPARVSFNVKDQTDNQLTIDFGSAGQIKSGIKGKNLLSLNTLQNDPLSVRVNFTEGSRTRIFPLSSRVVLDIYNPPVRKEPTVSNAEPPSQEEPSPRTQVSQAPDNVPEPDEDVLKRVQEAVEGVAGLEVKILNQEERSPSIAEQDQNKAEEPVAEEPQEPSQKEIEKEPPRNTIEKVAQEQVRPHRFTLSATQSVGMAVFSDFERLWLVTNREDLLVSPQVNGPNADFFRPIEEIEAKGGKAYLSKTISGQHVQGQGSGLLWNIFVMPEKPDEELYKPIKPERVGVDGNAPRSGKIIFPFKSAKRVVEVVDPVSGIMMKVVTVEDSEDFSGPAYQFVDFDVFPSAVGLAIRPKTDDLSIEITSKGVEISRKGGLAILPEEQVAGVEQESFEERMGRNPDERRIFNFGEWRMGGLAVLQENANVILSSMPDMSKDSQIENLITLAKMELSNGRGAEALGFLEYAQIELPELIQNPEFMSLLGVAKAFAWKTDEAFQDLSSPILEDYEEIKIWRAFTLADLGDWQQASEILPDNMSPLKDYPPEVLNRIGVVLSEIYLRAGEIKKAEQLFNLKANDNLNQANAAALKYLQGESARQKGEVATTKEFWKELAEGEDDLYRVKAGLALTRLLMEEGSIKGNEAIDRLERLRYAWRGDELEAQVNYWLGRTYFENGEYVKGLTIMRDAASLLPDTILGQRIARDMSMLFTDFFLNEELKDESPLDSVALYEQFQELVPLGEQGNRVISNLAEHMVQADLLDRAASLLKYQIDHRLSGDEAARTATRLAAINLIDKNPRSAGMALNKAQEFLSKLPEDVATKDRFQELSLLRARALSQDGKTDQALAILETLGQSPEVNLLRADIAWQSGFWDDAAYALEDVILDENISLTRPLSEEHAMLVLQRSVAQNLSGDRIGLANLREKYAESMSQTNKARLFDVVTRPRQVSGLADRETLLSTVAEIDLFGDFLNTYRDVNQNPSN